MQSTCCLGGHGQGLPVFLTEERFQAPEHIPALGSWCPASSIWDSGEGCTLRDSHCTH